MRKELSACEVTECPRGSPFVTLRDSCERATALIVHRRRQKYPYIVLPQKGRENMRQNVTGHFYCHVDGVVF